MQPAADQAEADDDHRPGAEFGDAADRADRNVVDEKEADGCIRIAAGDVELAAPRVRLLIVERSPEIAGLGEIRAAYNLGVDVYPIGSVME